MLNNHFTANLLQNLPVKELCKSVKIRQNYGHEFGVQFFFVKCEVEHEYMQDKHKLQIENALSMPKLNKW